MGLVDTTLQREAPGRVWGSHPDDMFPSSYHPYLVTTKAASQRERPYCGGRRLITGLIVNLLVTNYEVFLWMAPSNPGKNDIW